jgi:hypothetical protein
MEMDPFLFNLNSLNENDFMNDDFIELRANGPIRMEFKIMKLENFWCSTSTVSTTGERSAGDPCAICRNTHG